MTEDDPYYELNDLPLRYRVASPALVLAPHLRGVGNGKLSCASKDHDETHYAELFGLWNLLNLLIHTRTTLDSIVIAWLEFLRSLL